MKRWLLLLAAILAILSLLLTALWLAADAEGARLKIGGGYLWVLAAVAASVLVLVGVVGWEIWRLFRQVKAGIPGSRINARLVLLIAAIALPPIVLVSAFAIRFVDSSIDSWFRADVAGSQQNAEAIGRDVLQSFERRARDLSRRFASTETLRDGSDTQSALDALVAQSADPVHVTLYDNDGEISAISFNTSDIVFPSGPTEEERLQVREAGQLALNERAASNASWRILEATPGDGLVQLIYPIPVDLASRLEALERTAIDYSQLKFQRDAMKSTFMLILGLVGLLALLVAFFAALSASRRLVRPISDLAVFAGEIAQGTYGHALEVTSTDELGDLTTSFNKMSRELAQSNAREHETRTEIERSRERLEAILERLSAGVVSFDAERIRTANHAAGELLDVDPSALSDFDLAAASQKFPRAAPLFRYLRDCAVARRAQWRQEIRLEGEPVRALLVRGTLLPGDDEPNFVAVFDDAAVIALGQREAAWAEVAKRLAHEIKNPLTPIQLAAERLRHKYLGKMTAEDASVLDRATQTIVAQVDALKRIVNAFGDYTRTPQGELQTFDFCKLLDEVAGLYEHSGQCETKRSYSAANSFVHAHRERMRQALINIFTNAIEATETESRARVDLNVVNTSENMIAVTIRDHGKGLPVTFSDRWFEPYNTTKPKGSGLGLAWVKKVAEESGGSVRAANAEGGGAQFLLELPAVIS
jgi:nitrogen fixation/metabolism regulation signal transduction histidine kinase